MDGRRTAVLAAVLVALSTLQIPTVVAEHWPSPTVNDLYHDTWDCPEDGDNPEGIALPRSECRTWEIAYRAYRCVIFILENPGPIVDFVEDEVQRWLDQLWPTIKQTKCNTQDGVEEDAEWWNNDVRHWRDAWWCYANGGEQTCPDHPDRSLRSWLICRSYELAFGHEPDAIDCPGWGWDLEEILLDESPDALPPMPPYP